MHFILAQSALHCLPESDAEREREGHCAQGPLSWFWSKCHFVNNTASADPVLNIILDKDESKISESNEKLIYLTINLA